MTKSNIFPFIRVKGTNYDIGKQIGAYFKTRITQAFEECKEIKNLIEIDKQNPERLDRVESLAKTSSHFIWMKLWESRTDLVLIIVKF